MNQATKEAVSTIAALPEKERKQALAVASAAGKVYGQLKKRQTISLNNGPYRSCRSCHGKGLIDSVLIMMGADITGGDGWQVNKLTASLKKI